MQRIPGNNNQFANQRPVMVQPQTPKPKKHFRWGLLIIPGVILFFIWFVSGIEPSGTWSDFLSWIGIANKPRFSMLMILGILACTICAIARVIRDDSK